MTAECQQDMVPNRLLLASFEDAGFHLDAVSLQLVPNSASQNGCTRIDEPHVHRGGRLGLGRRSQPRNHD